ncbi:MAG TPA: NADH-quinone oxidoreductase subunit C [Bacteroidales bacterium]|nr:NADH-quinone oxidoreductase subunit C [Bacteroidales bacterium]
MFQKIIEKINLKYPIDVVSKKSDKLMFLTVHKNTAVNTVQYLKDDLGFKHLVLLTAVDFLEQGKFQLTYLLNNPDIKIDIGVRVLIERESATMESAHSLWPTIATYQRELREMFGIDFPDSPGVNDEFILEGWNNTPPYRRDFDTKAFAANFYHQRNSRENNDPSAHMKKNLYPNE